MDGIFFSFIALCFMAYTVDSKTCYKEQLAMDRWWDRPCVCNDGRKYPEQEIESALAYASEPNHMFLYTVSNYYNENNFFMDSYTAKGEYTFKSLCKTQSTRKQIYTVKNKDNNVCFVVRPNEQNIFFAECNGLCKLGYSGVPGYHCIPRGFTERSFLVYCPKKNIPCGSNIQAPVITKPVNGPATFQAAQFSPPHVPQGSGYSATGYFCNVTVVLPTYCGCRGYFCN